jgi:hypothetical protein
MKKIYITILLIFFGLIFHSWFLPGTISGFDHPYYFSERLREFNFVPFAWDTALGGNGLGQNIVAVFWVETFVRIVTSVFSNIFRLPWEMVQRVGWFFPYIVLSIFIPYYFLKSLRFKAANPLVYVIGSIVFSVNTYILMIIAGGQMNIALAYAFSPVILLQFIKSQDDLRLPKRKQLKHSIISGVLFALLLLLDLRLALLIFVAGFLYWALWFLYSFPYLLKKLEIVMVKHILLCAFVIPVLVTFSLHAFWILPQGISQQDPIKEGGAAYSSTNAVNFFSFAKLENTISLLHPNWPENIFGKVSFMKPEFLFIPILAFIGLLFLQKSEKDKQIKLFILYFALLGLLGAFLAKGTNDPFGGWYVWAFSHIPGFSLFRDSTKFYLYIAVSYLVLIPFSLWSISEWLTKKLKQRNLSWGFIFICLLYLLFLIRPALLGKLDGTLQTAIVPEDYFVLHDFLVHDTSFSRTLWIPLRQRYGFYDSTHPAVNAQDLFQIYDQKNLLTKLRDKKTEKLLQNSNIKYVIVPIDAEKELFLKDRKYSEQKYVETIKKVQAINWLRPVKQFTKLHVFVVSGVKDHFWSPNSNLKIHYVVVNPTEYKVSVQNAHVGDRLVFAEHYDQHWLAGSLSSQLYEKKFNSFVLSRSGNYTLEVRYPLQQWVTVGEVISFVALLIVVISIIFL